VRTAAKGLKLNWVPFTNERKTGTSPANFASAAAVRSVPGSKRIRKIVDILISGVSNMDYRCKFCDTRIIMDSLTHCPRCGAPVEKEPENKFELQNVNENKCPECGADLAFQEGCMKCIDPGCGWSACG